MQEVNQTSPSLVVQGRLTRMVGLTLEAAGCRAAVGDYCRIINTNKQHIDAEVVGFSGDNLFLMPPGEPQGLSPNARVLPLSKSGEVSVGYGLLGRILDGGGKPLDGLGPIKTEHTAPPEQQ